jgi:hypothetical protein
MSELAKALAAFQAELPTVKKGNTAKVPTKAGGEYKYQYADLTDITEVAMPLLSKHGLSFTSLPTMTDNGFVLAYRLLHVSGEADLGEYPLPDPAHNPAQTIGSAITYARRYAMCAATGIAPGGDDDDAKEAQSATPRRTRVDSPQEKVAAAVKAANECTDAVKLDGIEDHAKSLGIGGMPAVTSAIAAARARLGESGADHWAVKEVPS